jgi:hypothetical protein
MAKLADAADLKSAELKKLVGVQVPLPAPIIFDFAQNFACSQIASTP